MKRARSLRGIQMPESKPIEFIVTETGCFECTSHSRNSGGYCYYKRVGGKRTYVHRHIYEECFGFIPEGILVRHTCDNPSCINPDHMILGDDKDNARDRTERGRHNPLRGEFCHFGKLSEQDIINIRADVSSSNHDLAAKYCVTHSNISAIRLNKSWKHLRNT